MFIPRIYKFFKIYKIFKTKLLLDLFIKKLDFCLFYYIRMFILLSINFALYTIQYHMVVVKHLYNQYLCNVIFWKIKAYVTWKQI